MIVEMKCLWLFIKVKVLCNWLVVMRWLLFDCLWWFVCVRLGNELDCLIVWLGVGNPSDETEKVNYEYPLEKWRGKIELNNDKPLEKWEGGVCILINRDNKRLYPVRYWKGQQEVVPICEKDVIGLLFLEPLI